MRRGCRALVACTSLVVPLGALAFHGCAEVDHDAAARDGAVAHPADVTNEEVRARDATTSHTPPPRPAYVPDGWQLYEGYDPDCGFYIPTATEQFPPPLQWESCGPDLPPSDVACQRIAVNRDDPYEFLSSWVTTTVSSDGKRLFQVSKFTKSFVWRLVVDVDGQVRYGVMETDSNRCTLGGGYLWRDHYVLSLNEYQSSHREGYIVGELGSLTPSFAVHRTDGPHSLYVGPFGIVETGGGPDFHLYPWSALGSPGVLWTQDDGLTHSQFVFTDDAIFWTAGSYQGAKAKVRTEAGGVRDLISFGTDQTRGAGAFGTDGVAMVWLEGPPRPPNDGGLDTYAIMTAPYTTDPTQVQKRRLRSEVGSALSAGGFEVGCGFAARSRHDGLRIVRIADGHSWFLPNEGRWSWQRVHAITCDEVFLRAMNGTRADLVRVRLDSLGPGELPD